MRCSVVVAAAFAALAIPLGAQHHAAGHGPNAAAAPAHGAAQPAASAAPAPTPVRLTADLPAGPRGVIVVAHGGGPEWNAGVFEAVKSSQLTGPVEIAFLMGPFAKDHRFQDAVARLQAKGATHAVVVPLFVSSQSGHVEQIRWLMGLTNALDEVMHHHLQMSGIERPTVTMPMALTPALDDAAELRTALTDRALELAARKPKKALMLVGHGPNLEAEYAYWMHNLRAVAAEVRTRTGFADVRVGLVKDDAPAAERAEAVRHVRDLVELQAAASRDSVVVVPILLAPGKLTKTGLPRDLANLPVRYTGTPILPHPVIGAWIRRMVESVPTSVASR